MRIVSGEFKGRRIKAVPGRNTRPTTDKVKESLFNIIGPYFDGGDCLDLFAGSGNLGLEAISRGMDTCIFIDRDYKAFSTIRDNVKTLNVDEQVEVYKRDAFKALKQIATQNRTFDLIFLDPPYKHQQINDIIFTINEEGLLNNAGMIIAEYPKEDFLEKQFGTIEEYKTLTYGITKITIFIKEVE
ncbi:16S rRNA (guanine(966)-N(2))-methyltransferase RsmD [Haloplasma contractile]|uniref:16S rRNA (Guanine(966)-N(2))-methyltransferase RsmD n=1 Tax=Haloplasma contractile SSD-17B TaxID=1033810 RepID=U2EFL5_9MOLU|nr:16S rRNA (guanine(966)-N(2))-methyltransferase RsmD [Haloplasma contractile]ERJ13446.1 Methyltransferase putative protein [Haloplasma contractile SSD-17B]